MELRGKIENNDPRNLNFNVCIYEPFWCMVGSFVLEWLVMQFGWNIGLASVVEFGTTYTLRLAPLFVAVGLFSLYNLAHNLFCIIYMSRHDLIETKQPWKYLIRIKWYNEW